MKKRIAIAMVSLLIVASMAGCSSKTDSSEVTTVGTSEESKAAVTESEKDASAEGFKEENGVLTCLDVKNSPFDQSGLRITVDKTAKTVKLIITDLEGNDTVEYFVFDFNANIVEKYSYSSGMGTGYYYTYDLTEGEVVKIESDEREDKTESTKTNGRFDGANEKMKGEVASLESYFSKQYGKTISELVL